MASTPAVTNQTVPATAGGSYTVNLGTRLMENQQTGSPVDPGKHFEVVQDKSGNPILFTIGNDGALYAIWVDASSSTGWSQAAISAALGGAGVQAIASYQDPNTGLVTLAVAKATSSADNTSNVYVTAPFDPGSASWTSFSSWVTRPRGSASGTAIAQMLIGPGNSGQHTLIVAGDRTNGSTYFLVSLDTTATTNLWTEMSPATDATSVIDVSLGRISDMGAGMFTLYHNGDALQLVFATFPIRLATGWTRSLFRRLTVPAGANTLEAGPDNGTETELYVGATGLFLFPRGGLGRDASGTLISGTDALGAIVGLIVQGDSAGNVVAWPLAQDETLYTLQRAAGQATWSTPIPMHQGASQIATLRDQARQSNQMFTIDNDSTVHQLWQDPTSTLWQDRSIAIHDTGALVQLQTYTYSCQVLNPDGTIPSGVSVAVSASAWSYVTINGAVYVLDEQSPVTVRPDSMGTVTVVFSTTTMDVPEVRFSSPQFTGTLTLDGGKAMRDSISAMSSSDLGNATYSQGPNAGQKVVSGSFANNTDAAASTFSSLQSVDGQIRSGNSGPESFAGPAPMVLETHAVVLGKGGARHHRGDAAESLLMDRMGGPMSFAEGASIGDAILVAAGDLLHAIWNGLKKVGSFFIKVIDDVANFIVEVAGQLFRFVLNTIEVVARAFAWVLKELLGIDLSKLLQWLGFIFDWDDIKTTHTVLVNLTNSLLSFAESEVDSVADTVNAFFLSLEDQIRALAPISGSGGSASAQQVQQDTRAQNSALSNAVTADPGVNYANYHLQYSGVSDALVGGDQSSDPFTAFYNDVLAPAAESIANTFSTIFQDLGEAFTNSSLTANYVLEKLGVDILLGLVDTARAVVVGIIQFAGDMIGWVKDLINEKISIPFLSALYKWIVGTDMTFLDAVALLVAIPTTILYKLATNRSPWADGTMGLDSQDQSGIFGGSSAVATFADTGTISKSDKLYSQIGGFLGAVLGIVGAVISGFQNFTRLDMLKPGFVDQDNKLKNRVSTLNKINLAVTTAYLAVTFPVADGAAKGVERAVWGAYVFLWVKGLAFLIPALEKFEKASAGIDLGGAVVKLVLELTIFIMELVDKETDSGDALLTFVRNLLVELGEGGIALGDILGPKNEAGAIATVLGVGSNIIGQGLEVVRDTLSVINDVPHSVWGTTPSAS